jgi:hypothetical protein
MYKMIIALLMPIALAACAASSEALRLEADLGKEQRRIEREEKYGKCPHDRWRSISVIGKTKTADAIRTLKACDVEYDISRHVSVGRVTEFVHVGTEYTWHFVNGVLASYRR